MDLIKIDSIQEVTDFAERHAEQIGGDDQGEIEEAVYWAQQALRELRTEFPACLRCHLELAAKPSPLCGRCQREVLDGDGVMTQSIANNNDIPF